MAKIGLGVVGCGDVAFRTYFPAIATMGDKAGLVAVCDTRSERAKKAREQFGAARAYADLEALLDDKAVDVVVNLTNVSGHAGVGMKALQARKHLYQEKPIASTLADADALIDEAEHRDLLIVCAPGVSLTPARQRVADVVRSGELGRVGLARATGLTDGPARWDDYSSDPSWFYEDDVGPLIDTGVYAVDYLVHVLGPARRVSAFAGLVRPDIAATARGAAEKRVRAKTPDTYDILLEFDGPSYAQLACSFCVPVARGPAVEFFGDKGTIAVWEVWDTPQAEMMLAGEQSWTPLDPPEAASVGVEASYVMGLSHLVDCFLTGEKPVLDGRRGRHVLEVMLAAKESASTGKSIELARSPELER